MRRVQLAGNGAGAVGVAAAEKAAEFVDLDLDEVGDDERLATDFGLGPGTVERLRKPGSRNRRIAVAEGLLLLVCYAGRGGDEGADQSDTRLALLVAADRVLCVRRGAVPEVDSVYDHVSQHHHDAVRVWHLLALLVLEIAGRMESGLDQIAGRIDRLEDVVFGDPEDLPIDELGQIRRRLIRDRRYATSLSMVVEETAADRALHVEHRSGDELTAAAEAMTRQERTISFALERANLLQEQIQSLQNERMNRATLRLGVVATVFLPLGFITGLLGINVAGIPGNHNPEAFWQVCGLLLALALVAWGVVARIHRT